jgi:ComF family protein
MAREYPKPFRQCQPMALFQVHNWLRAVQGWILPPTCIRCGCAGRPPVFDLCEFCEADLPKNGNPCRACGLPIAPDALGSCRTCSRRRFHFDCVLAPCLYEYPVDRLVQRFKYEGRLEIGRVLATLLSRAAQDSGVARPEALLPVPLARSKLRSRGFNQAVELALPVANALSLPIRRDLCMRVRGTQDQAGLRARDRRRNVEGAFAVASTVVPRHIALIDDVLTTGSTCGEIARVLKEAGAERVDVWVVARAMA